MLASQTGATQRFGGERFTSTDLDFIGAGIWRLLRGAERLEQGGNGRAEDDEADLSLVERTVTFRA